MIKADFTITPSQQQKQAAEEKINELKNNAELIRMMNVHELPLNLIQRSPFRIAAWFEGLAPCMKCKGLQECGQKQKGYYDNLAYDGLLQRVQTACRFERDKMKGEAHLEKYLISDLPASYSTVSFEQTDTSNESDQYLDVFAEAMEACSSSKGLYIYGNMGSGKTYLSACACNYHAKQGETVAFIHYPSFCRRMADGVHEGEYKTEFKRACFAKFLVIDDIGAESVTEWNRDQILLPLLSKRYEDGLATWFTSNEDIESLGRHFRYSSRGKEEEIKAARIIERIEHLAAPTELVGKDRRSKL